MRRVRRLGGELPFELDFVRERDGGMQELATLRTSFGEAQSTLAALRAGQEERERAHRHVEQLTLVF